MINVVLDRMHADRLVASCPLRDEALAFAALMNRNFGRGAPALAIFSTPARFAAICSCRSSMPRFMESAVAWLPLARKGGD